MSGLEAFSMVCNVMTVISFGLEAAKLCRNIHKSGSSDPELAKNAQWIRENSKQLLTPQRPATTDAEKRLHEIASECLGCAKAIEEAVREISPKKPGLFRAMKSTVKTMRQKPHLDQLKERLQAFQTTMDTNIISQVLQECISSGEINRSNYETLIRDQKAFNMAHEQRSQVVENLIRQFHGSIKEEIVKGLKTIEDKIDVVDAKNYDRQAHEKLLRSLKYDGMNERRNTIPRRHEETFGWIFEGMEPGDSPQSDSEPEDFSEPDIYSTAEDRDAYYEKKRRMEGAKMAKTNQRDANLLGWLQEDSHDLYWISGKPGSGKSTFTKFIMTDGRTKTALQSWRSRPEIISHFLWKPGSRRQQSLHGLVCSLLYQVLVDDDDVSAQLLHDRPDLRHKSKDDDWEFEDLKSVLFAALRASSRSYLIILDGLDELSKPHMGMKELFELLDQFKAEDGVKLCVSSRPERIFEETFASGRLLRMQDLTFQDILNFTLATLNDITLEADEHLKEKIAAEISKKSEGVFIWVHVVLQNVKNGIYEFNETWNDIYNRITELPPDIMELYKDMWARLGARNSKKYVKQAALYFQLVRLSLAIEYTSPFLRCLACLAVASDDDIMETCTGPDTVPSFLAVVERCERTHKTLHTMSSGLLETNTSFFTSFPASTQTGDADDPESYNWDLTAGSLDKKNPLSLIHAMRKWGSHLARVSFTHRTAIDFLDSDEGKTLFGQYTLNEGAVFLKLFKSGIILGSQFWFLPTAQFLIGRLLSVFRDYYKCDDYFRNYYYNRNYFRDASIRPIGPRPPPRPLDAAAYDLLHLFHSCVARVERFYGDPEHDLFGPWKGKARAFFIFTSAKFGICDFVTEILQSSEYGNIETADNALMGICCVSPREFGEDLCSGQQRCDLIQKCLQSPHRRVPDSSRSIVTAWHCFLRHHLTGINHFWGHSPDNSIIKDTLETFISAGVMDQQPPPRYLIHVADGTAQGPPLKILKTSPDCRFDPDEQFKPHTFHDTSKIVGPVFYVELNHNFLLQQLSNHISVESDLISQTTELGFWRPILAAQQFEGMKLFTCKPNNDEEREALEKWIFEEFMRSGKRIIFPHDFPPHLKMEELEGFEKVSDALNEFGDFQTTSTQDDGCFSPCGVYYDH